MKTTDDLIIFEQTFNAPLESVWNAITDVNLMRKWYFNNIPDFKATIGFTTQFDVTNGDRNFRHQWKVTEVIPEKIIKYEWTFEGYKGRSTTLFELFAKENSTKLILTVEVLEDFPDDIPEFKRESCIGGWNYFINNRLKDYLDKT